MRIAIQVSKLKRHDACVLHIEGEPNRLCVATSRYDGVMPQPPIGSHSLPDILDRIDPGRTGASGIASANHRAVKKAADPSP